MQLLKRLHLITLLTLLTGNCVYAQLSLRGGFGLSNFTYTDDDEYAYDDISFDSKLNFHLGISYERAIYGESIYLQPSLLLHHKGATGINNYRFGMNYIELPIKAVYKYKTASYAWTLGGGLYFAYALNGKKKEMVLKTTLI